MYSIIFITNTSKHNYDKFTPQFTYFYIIPQLLCMNAAGHL